LGAAIEPITAVEGVDMPSFVDQFARARTAINVALRDVLNPDSVF